MKVKIGPYKSYWGAYQIADLLMKVGVSEDRCHEIGEWLSKTKFQKLLSWIYSKRKRKVKVKIDGYDIWNADETMSMIIHPILVRLASDKCGYALVDDEDVPEEYRSYNAPPKENEWDVDDLAETRWYWVLEEMIYAHDPDWDDKYGFGAEPYDSNEYDKHQARRNNGFRLFGKYYQALWT